MKLHTTAIGATLLGTAAVSAAKNGLPVDKVYGVNLGSWLLSEPWMFPNEWKSMGGEICDDCSTCAMSEYALVKKLGQNQADKVFAQHWSTWFTQANVNAIADANLNTVRIPLGYWIIEDLVDRSTEFYPRGGMKFLKQGLRMLKAKGIHAILDFHAMPGVSSANQMFAGRCTTDVQFYTEKNYNRALVWAAVMTAMTHMDPDFSSVFSIEAINEPEMDYNKTPGLGDYETDFVKVVRMVELSMGVQCPDADYTKLFPGASYSAATDLGILAIAKLAEPVYAAILEEAATCLHGMVAQLGISDHYLKRALGGGESVRAPAGEAPHQGANVEVPHGSSLERHKRRAHRGRGVSARLNKRQQSQCLTTSFMNKDWQYNNPANPADAAIGPQFYDAHLYFSFGGVADPNPDSYMKVICNTDRVAKAVQVGNSPLVFGEWSLATNFEPTDQFLHNWSDAQRHIYAGQADGWIFWSFKIEAGSPNIPAWSYFDALERGYFSKDPSKLGNPDVCAPWMASAASS